MLEATGTFPMELEFSATLLIQQLVSSGRSTEPEVRIYTAGEVEQLESTVAQYLMEQVFTTTLLLDYTQQALVSD